MNASICPKGHDTSVKGYTKDSHCKACKLEYSKTYKKTKGLLMTRSAWRTGNFKHAGIKNPDGSFFTALDYDRIYQTQGGRCANMLCGRHQSELKGALCADHDHETGVIRGLLCRQCNIAIGMVRENKTILRGLMEYLQRG